MENDKLMRIGELEKKSGIPRSTIHFYLRQQLLHPPLKTGRTMAYYDESHLKRLHEIRQMKNDMRMPIEFIKRQIDRKEQSGGEKKAREDRRTAGKPANTPRDRRKQEIIQVAIGVFTEKGYHATKVADITERLKISTGTFYIYFDNKRDLFVEVVDDVFRRIVGEAAAAIEEESDFRRRLEIRGRVFYENYLKYNEILYQLRAEMAAEDQWSRKKIKKMYHGLTGPVIREIRSAVESGIIRNMDADLLAYALTGLIEIMCLRVRLDATYSYQEIIRFIRDLVTRGALPIVSMSDSNSSD